MARRIGCWLVVFYCLVDFGSAARLGQAQDAIRPPDVRQGEFLFERDWTARDARTPAGDGLGPVMNAASCAACHPGGGGSNRQHNVHWLSVVRRADASQRDVTDLDTWLEREHPLLAAQFPRVPTIMVHRQSVSDGYGHWRLETLTGQPVGKRSPRRLEQYLQRLQQRLDESVPVRMVKSQFAHEFWVSERNSPALFGLSEIDRIPDETIRALAAEQASRGDGIAGKVSLLSDGRVGRFGWRGQVGTLDEFVRQACAGELGLQLESHRQASDPLQPGYSIEGADLTQDEFADMLAFVRSLPQPERDGAEESELNPVITAGENVFKGIGCAQCHVENVGVVMGLYSDLLLHDMGTELADPVPGRWIAQVGQQRREFGGYGFGSIPMITMVRSEETAQWRTPPLWGIADSGPYLHDGRAATLHEAIVLHGGEAAAARGRYLNLPPDVQQQLLQFLGALRAPAAARQETNPHALGMRW